MLESLGEPTDYGTLCEKLGLEGLDAREALRRRLIAMARDGQIASNRRGVYGLSAHMDLQPGRVQGNRDGSGYFVPDGDADDLYLTAREMESLFDGDRVLARLTGIGSRGRKEGTVVEVLERRYRQIVGRFYPERGIGMVIPGSSRISHEILIPAGEQGAAREGQFVVAEILEYPARRRNAIGRVVEILGDVGAPGLEIDVAIRSHDIPHEWSRAVQRQARHLPDAVQEPDFKGRQDLRHLPFVTIDGEDAKDFDDAVFAERHRNGSYTLYVAIADVSHYVEVDTPLDEAAEERGTSVYFPGHVVPMLPEKLSNGLCSLRPEENRLAMVCRMELSSEGETTGFCFTEAVIYSHARLTYTEVADMVQSPASDGQEKIRERLRKRHESLIGHLDSLYSLYKVLHSARMKAGAMEFDSAETRIVFGEDRRIREILPVERNDAHRLIEECMLKANVAAAELLEHAGLPALYRVHQGPNPDKLENLREFLASLGLYLPGGETPSPQDYQQVLQDIQGRPDQHMLQTSLIRSMMQAVYQPDNIGHFGLAFPCYTHFTSPIRRYPDLLVHRAIRHLIRNSRKVAARRQVARQKGAPKLPRESIYPYSMGDLDRLGDQCSAAERRADAASYEVLDWLKCEYMQHKLGEEFSGTVTSVTSFGLFVELTDVYVEGLVHITELSNDYYHYDPVMHSLEGERSRAVYRIGDEVAVRVARVDLEEKKIDLQLVSSHPASNRGAKGKGRKAGGSGPRGSKRGSGVSRQGSGAAGSASEKVGSKGKKKSQAKSSKAGSAGGAAGKGKARKPGAKSKKRKQPTSPKKAGTAKKQMAKSRAGSKAVQAGKKKKAGSKRTGNKKLRTPRR